MYIETTRLLLRDFLPEDEQSLIHMASDGSLQEIWGDCSNCHIWMKDFIRESAALAQKNDPTKEYLAYAIEEKEKHMLLGSLGCSFYEDIQEVGLTWFIGADHRGMGYMAEALRAYIQYFFGHYRIPRLIATIREDNIASWKTAEKAGLVLEKKAVYQDIYDKEPSLSRFYAAHKNLGC